MKNRIIFTSILVVSMVLLTCMTLGNSRHIDDSLELHTIMRLIMMDVHEINEGIYTENYNLIENGAAGINNHPPLSDESRKLVQETLGNDMAAFSRFDDMVHARADSIRLAAEKQEMDQVLRHYRVMQQGCVNCHSMFQNVIKRERLSGSQD